MLDALRRQCNVSDYTGDDVDDSTVEHCIGEAERLLADVHAWLKMNQPQLLAE